MNSDQLLAGASVMLVYVAMYVHTRSIFMTTVGILAIALSIPVGVFIYKIIFNNPYFNNIHIVAVFLILGIGADDFFVFVDAWNQSKIHWKSIRGLESIEDAGEKNHYGTGDAEKEVEIARLSYAWKRAGTAIFNTSFTTTVAFISTAISPITPVAGFGIYAAMLVVLNFIFTVTLYPSWSCSIIVT